jgi:hypothetical protein
VFNGDPFPPGWYRFNSGLSDPRNTATSRHTGYLKFTIDSMRKSLGLFFQGQSLGYRWTVYKVYNKLFHVVNIFSQFRLCKCWYGQWDDPGSENDQIKNCLKPISKTWKLDQKHQFQPGCLHIIRKSTKGPYSKSPGPTASGISPNVGRMRRGCTLTSLALGAPWTPTKTKIHVYNYQQTYSCTNV